MRGQLRHLGSFDCQLLEGGFVIVAVFGGDLLARFDALAVLVEVGSGLAANVNRHARGPTPLTTQGAAESLNRSLAFLGRRRGNVAFSDGDQKHVILDRIKHLVGEHTTMTIPDAISLRELGAHVRAFVALGAKKHASRYAKTHRDLVHEVLDEAGKGRRWARWHHLDLVRGVEVFDHAHVGELVLALLAVLERDRRSGAEGLPRRG